MTTIINVFGRRSEILEELLQEGLLIRNFNDRVTIDSLEELLSETKILINLHQVDYYHTAEEFRLLPALIKGCIIVSEDVPLRNLIPYHEYIIWVSDRSELADTLRSVQNNYDYFYNLIHGSGSGLLELIEKMKVDAYEHLEARLLSVVTSTFY